MLALLPLLNAADAPSKDEQRDATEMPCPVVDMELSATTNSIAASWQPSPPSRPNRRRVGKPLR